MFKINNNLFILNHESFIGGQVWEIIDQEWIK